MDYTGIPMGIFSLESRSFTREKIMNMFHYAIIVSALSLAACGGGGNPPPVTKGFAVSAATARAEPLQRIELTPSDSADTRAGYKVQVDVSGTTGFAPENTLNLPGMVEAGHIVVAAPVLEMARTSSTASVPVTFALRVRRDSDGAMSPPLSFDYDRIEIPAQRRGAPSTLLRLSFKALFAESKGVLASRAPQVRAGQLADATSVLSPDSTLADLQAEAILRQVFGFTTIAKPINSAGASALAAPGGRAHPLGAIDEIKAGYQTMFDCLGNQVAGFGNSWGEVSADNCFDIARQAIRDQIIPGLSSLQSRIATIASGINSMSSRLFQRVAGPYVERMVFSAEMTEYTVDLAQIALTIPGVTALPSETADFVLGKITDTAKKKLYGQLIGNLTEIDKQALDLVYAPEAFSELVDLAGDKLAKVNQIGDMLSSLNGDSERMKDLSSEFGGADGGTPDTVSLGPLGSINVDGQAETPSSVCTQHPELDAAVQSLGFASCESFVQPFFDRVYFKTAIQPINAQLLGLDLNQLTACANTLEDPGCQALFAQYAALGEQMTAALKAYATKTFKCDTGYTQYDNSSHGLTCVFGALAYTPSGGACFAGSNPAAFDVGSANVCIYYARDYLQSDGGCRTNYAKVIFDGRQTCRWATLPPTSPAAYAINTDSGDHVTLLP